MITYGYSVSVGLRGQEEGEGGTKRGLDRVTYTIGTRFGQDLSVIRRTDTYLKHIGTRWETNRSSYGHLEESGQLLGANQG